MWMMRSSFSKILDTLFPKRCFACKKEGQSLCKRCIDGTRKSLETPHPYILSIFSFKDPLIRQAIHALKYYHRRDIIPVLAQHLAQEMRQRYYSGVLVPIPMPRGRLYVRGYNQAKEIARELSKELGLPLSTSLLARKLSPSRQVTHIQRRERLRNQRGSFIVTSDLRELDIILVDDVTTTGATIDEARTALLRAGARSVQAVTLAH
jgi:ComF family protein